MRGTLGAGEGSFIGAGGSSYANTRANAAANQISGVDSFIGAGVGNTIAPNEAFIGSGARNAIENTGSLYAVIGGGYGNRITAPI